MLPTLALGVVYVLTASVLRVRAGVPVARQPIAALVYVVAACLLFAWWAPPKDHDALESVIDSVRHQVAVGTLILLMAVYDAERLVDDLVAAQDTLNAEPLVRVETRSKAATAAYLFSQAMCAALVSLAVITTLGWS